MLTWVRACSTLKKEQGDICGFIKFLVVAGELYVVPMQSLVTIIIPDTGFVVKQSFFNN